MDDRDGWIWYDGKLTPWRDATTHVLTHSLHYGLAVIEGIRAYPTASGSAVFRLSEHTERWFASAHIYGMRLPFTRAEMLEAQLAVLRANQLTRAYLRPLAFYGPEKMGLSPVGARVHVAIAAWEWNAYLRADAAETGIVAGTASFTRNAVNASLPRAKVSASYANSILAHAEAQAHGYDEALLLDVDGFVAEGSGENLFLVKAGQLYEPEPTSALPGITRDTLHTLAKERGYRVHTRRLTRDDVYCADEAFFCGTAAEVLPLLALDGRSLGDGRPGPVTRALQGAYADAVAGRDARHLDWLTLA